MQAEQQQRVESELQSLLASLQPSSVVRQTTSHTDKSMLYTLHELRNDAVAAFLHAGDLSNCSSQQSSCSDVELLSSSTWSSSVISQPLATHAHQSQEQESFLRPRAAGHSKQSAHTRRINNCLYKTAKCRTWERKGKCSYGSRCQFAHGTNDLRSIQHHPKYKTEVCASFAQSGSCPYGSRCRFIHPHDITSCNSSSDTGRSKQMGQTVHQARTPLASYGTSILPPATQWQSLMPPPMLTSSHSTLPPLSCHLDRLPQQDWKLTCPGLSMLPQYSANPLPTPCQDISSQLWHTSYTQESAIPVYAPMTTTQPANTKQNITACSDQLLRPCDKYNIWAATDPFAHVRTCARDDIDAVLPQVL